MKIAAHMTLYSHLKLRHLMLVGVCSERYNVLQFLQEWDKLYTTPLICYSESHTPTTQADRLWKPATQSHIFLNALCWLHITLLLSCCFTSKQRISKRPVKSLQKRWKCYRWHVVLLLFVFSALMFCTLIRYAVCTASTNHDQAPEDH